MKIKEVSEQISAGLIESFQKHGFKYRKTNTDFIRKGDQADHVFKMFYYKEDDGTITIKPEIIIHVHSIEDVYRSVSESNENPYLTLGNYLSEIAEYNGDEVNFRKRPIKYWLIEDENDIEYLVKIIPKYLKEDMLPYFEENSTIKRVDELLNKYPEKMTVHNYIYPDRVNIAIIAAKLNNNPNYEELVDIYEKNMIDAEENSKKQFYRLKELLGKNNYNL